MRFESHVISLVSKTGAVTLSLDSEFESHVILHKKYNYIGDEIMLDPNFLPYLTNKNAKTEHGYEYIVLSKDTPKDLFDEYMKIIGEQDGKIARGERIIMF